MMTPEQEKHLAMIKERFVQLADGKYRRGATEHDGNLSDMPVYMLLEEAISEAIDQVVYLLTLQEALRLNPSHRSPPSSKSEETRQCTT